MGMVMSVLLPAIMAPLPESYVASSSATYSFVRTFGYIWGVAVPSLIFNSVFDHNLFMISDPVVEVSPKRWCSLCFCKPDAYAITYPGPSRIARSIGRLCKMFQIHLVAVLRFKPFEFFLAVTRW